MIQLVYCILAILILSILTMTSQRGIAATLQGQTLVELESQLTGVGTEVLERVGQSYFDHYAYTHRASAGFPRYCGRIRQDRLSDLAAPGSFVQATGATAADRYAAAPYIEAFHGIATTAAPLTLRRSGIDYLVTSITVDYVNPATLAPSSTQTLAKRVTVRVENPNLYVGENASNTFALNVSRVFTYGCVADFNQIPAGTTCPTVYPCARW